MQIAVRHNLQVYDPADEAHREAGAFVLPVRDAEAVMGETIAAYLARVEWRFDLPTVCRINGEFYGRAEWATRAVGVNDNIEFLSRPLTGGSSSGGSAKSIMGVVALIALTVLAPYAVAAAGAAVGASAAIGATAATLTFAGKLAAAAIIGAGALVVSHFLKPKAGGKTSSSDELYSFGFQGNAARPMQPIPVLNGRLKFAPDYAAPTYSEYSGDTMTDYALFALTCGRMQVEQILIGDTPIWNKDTGYNPDYPGIEIEIVEPGEQVDLYPVNVVTAEELQGVELQQAYTPSYIINAAGTRAKELIFDFIWSGGAFVTYKDRMLPATTHVRVEVRQVDAAGAPITGWTILVDDQYVQAKDSAIRLTVRRIVEPARYEVRARRMNPSVEDSGVQKVSGTDAVTWTAARAHIEGPQSFPRVMTLAVKGVASKSNSGISGGQLRVIGTRILPVWEDGFFVEKPTRSIAWAALDWWRNSDYAAGLSLRDVDFQAFVNHDALWAQLGHTFDFRFTEVTTLDDVLETVLKAGRAFPSPVGDKLTITRDQPRVLPRMLFTDNDIVAGSFEIDYALSDESWADGLVAEYVDQTTWRLAEVSSAPDGVTLLKPGRVQLQGIVDRKQATGIVRMMAAESQYRRITATWTARLEGRLLKKGDLVHVSTEMPETWGASHEIVSFVSGERRLTLDPAPEWTAGSNHYLEIRQRDGRPWGPVKVTRGRNDSEAIVDSGDAASAEGRFGVDLDDAVYRSNTQEPGWAVFSIGQPRSFPILIKEGDPDQDGEHITLTGVVDAAEVYTTTENGVPPLLQIPDLYSSLLPVIEAISARIQQRHAALILTVGWPAARNAVTYDAAVSYDAGATWIGAYSGDRTTFEAIVASSDQMKVRVRGITPQGVPGGWSVVDVDAPDLVIPGMLIDVETLPPIDYEGLAAGVRTRIENALDTAAQGVAIGQDALSKAGTALDRALESLGNDAVNAAAIISESNARTTADGAIATRIDGVVAKTDENAAAVLSEITARTTADGALGSRIDTVVARTGENTAAITSEQTARTDADSALGQRIDVVVAQTGNNLAAITSEQTARTNADSALGQRIDTVVAQAGDALAAVTSEQTARVNADGALSSRIDAVVSTANGNTAGIVRIDQSISDIYVAQASTNIDLYARNDQGTAFGRFAMQAVAGPSGVTSRLEILLASQRGGQTFGAGMIFDLYADGSSAVRFDANKFYITAPGASGVPAFSFDSGTGTLRVPNLVLTSGQASIPLRIDIPSYTLIAGAGTVNDQIDANLNFTWNVTAPDFPATIEVFGKITISGPQNTQLTGMRLIVDGVLAGYFRFNDLLQSITSGAGNNTFDFRCSCIRYLNAGIRSIRIQYSYTSPGAGQVQINELHIAGFQPKA